MIRKPITTLFIFALAAMVSGCVSSTYESEAHYTPSSTMTRQAVERCRVLEARWVDISAQSTRHGRSVYSQYDNAMPSNGAKTGAAIGAVLGAALARDASNNPYATLAGALIGSAAGSNIGHEMDKNNPRNRGVEYSIIQADGSESVIIQPHGPGDRLVAAGQSCRLVMSNGRTRVLPAEQLPGSIRAPKTTKIR